ncbi:MAG TPA: helix-turn-helix transcriptional regulator [Afipia sp.]
MIRARGDALRGDAQQGVARLDEAQATELAIARAQWLLDRRIDRARRLLLTPNLTIAEVALACGFASQSHFHKVFTARAGLSPGLRSIYGRPHCVRSAVTDGLI